MCFSAAELQEWLRRTVLPFWATDGFDSVNGAFVEKLDLQARPSREDYTRVRVQARQIYVFAHAHKAGLYPDGLTRAQAAYTFLSRHAWDRESGGWYHLLRRNGTPLERTKDCYDHAFILLALAWLYQAGADEGVLAQVHRTMEFLDRALRLERGGDFDGYREHWVDPGQETPLPRRQNPHMHLLEAFLALHEATGGPEWLARAKAIVGLFTRHFYDAETGQLTEFFGHDWRERARDGVQLREPGHHFEWVWLLHRYGQFTGEDWVRPVMRRLFDWAWRRGIDRREGGIFGAYDAIDPDGQVLAGGSKRLWPQTEALKACLALGEAGGDPAAKDGAAAILDSLFGNFVSREHALWHDQFSGTGAMIAPAIPASSLYHLYLAISEVLRLGNGKAAS